MDTANRKIERAIITAISLGFVMWSLAFIYRASFIALDGKRYFCLFDDAMISMRYAWNLSHGFGLVWNPGVRIEGYTNLLMTLIMSLPTWIFDKTIAVLSIQILGIGSMLIIAFASMRISDQIVQDEAKERQFLIGILTFFCSLFYYPLAFWSLMGMETGLLSMLLLLAILFTLKYARNKNPVLLFVVSGCLGLAFLTRIDSAIFAALLWSYIILKISEWKLNRKLLWQVAGAIGLYSLFVMGQLVFQYIYYDELLPNTYTLKLTGMPLFTRIGNGIGFIKPFLIVTAFVLIISVMGFILGLRKPKILLASIVLSTIGYQIYVGGDPWDYWRIMSPAMPLLIVLFISAVDLIILAISRMRIFNNVFFLRNSIFSWKHIGNVLTILFILMGLLSMNRMFLPEILLLKKPFTTEYNQQHVNVAVLINYLTTNDATVGVLAAGSIPYFTGRRAIDFLGKSDKYIAHLPPDISGSVAWAGMKSVPGHNKYDLNYSIKTLKPTYIETFMWGKQNLSQWVGSSYIGVEYGGAYLFLLKDSPAVLWDRVNNP